MDKTEPYKVYSYDCWKMYDEDEDMFGVVASFDTLDEAVAFCKKSIDHEIADAIKKAEAGEITTLKEIEEARSELSTFGWNYYVSNAEDPTAKDAFDFLVYAERRLTEIVERRRADFQ